MRKNIQKILIPVGFREPSVKALHYAAYLAAKTEAALVLHYVMDTPGLLAQFFKSTDHLVRITDEAHHIMNLSDVPVLSLTSMSIRLDFSSFFKALADPMSVIINMNK